MDDSIGIYIHIPFCKSKCFYCDFNSYSGRENLAGSYFNALYDEIRYRSDTIGDRRVSSVFIGGGTPSLVDPDYIRGLMEVCSKYMDIDENAEISMESNPGTMDYEKLRQYRQMGINRLSIGLQAWQDSLLKSIGRIHDRQQFIDNLDAATKAGFENINVDLIFGLPGQTFEDWSETIEKITSFDKKLPASQEQESCSFDSKWNKGSVPLFQSKVKQEIRPHVSLPVFHKSETRDPSPCFSPVKHISCYSLKIEEGTVLGDRVEAGKLVPVDDELDRRMYHYAVEFLGKKGYRHYEISNFAYPGHECRHNLIYWKAREYAGFGAGAHSFLDSVRFNNVYGIEQYIMAVGNMIRNAGSSKVQEGELFENKEPIDRNGAMAEFMILGLRLTEGITSYKFMERFGVGLEEVYGEKLSKLADKGLISAETDCACDGCKTYKLTSLGLDLANSVFVEFI